VFHNFPEENMCIMWRAVRNATMDFGNIHPLLGMAMTATRHPTRTNVPETAIEPNVQNGPSLAADGSADSDDDDECMSDKCSGSERPQTPLSSVACARAI
jgi:hypothetical protein